VARWAILERGHATLQLADPGENIRENIVAA